MDFFVDLERKIDDVGLHVELPDAGGRRLFIVNVQFPTYAPANPLWGASQTDGETVQLVLYFAMPSEEKARADGVSMLWNQFIQPGSDLVR